MDKLLFRCVLFLSLCMLLVTVPIISSVKASGIIYIRADGTVEGTDNIQRDGNVYTFTGNVNGPIVVERDNIVVDGSDFSLQGTGIGTGINLTGRTNVTIKNIEISDFFYGVYLNFSLNNSLSTNNVRNNMFGIFLSESSGNTIIGNNVTTNDASGIWFRHSSNNNINENRVTENLQDGVWLSSSSDNNKVLGNLVRENGHGFRLNDYSNNRLRNNDFVDNDYNFGVYGSLLPEFIQDIDESNVVNGKPICYWVNRHDETVPLDAGYVALVNCSGITVENLNLSNNGQGVLLAYTADSQISENNITDNIHGIFLSESSSNTVTWNNITKSSANGIYLYYSQNNMFFHNNFISNTNQVYDVGASSNIWDNGVEGNYWSNYNVTDDSGDGIGDTQYVIDANNQDDYPLINEIPEFPSWIILPLFLMATLFSIIIKKRVFNQTQ